ncbi:MAG: hypothetical protein ABS882_07670 [Lysinibacillus sp.]
MSKLHYLIIILLLFILYNAVTWQHLLTQQHLEQAMHVRIYYAVGLALFLLTTFFTYLLEKTYSLSRLATCIYIALFITGAPFLYKLFLYILLTSIPNLWH